MELIARDMREEKGKWERQGREGEVECKRVKKSMRFKEKGERKGEKTVGV